MTALEQLPSWLPPDYEARRIEVRIEADDPEYVGGVTDAHAVWNFHYAVTAVEVALYGGEEVDFAEPASLGGAHTVWQHTGYGDSLDAAAAACLRMIDEHRRVIEDPANALAPQPGETLIGGGQ
ncbi:MAG TPA: hypothetical protein PLV68_06840 [Ilumatobacteraceae bacterium]|nr:hypothetical protein [Ilumatobacteraceae bacterium]